MGLADVLKVVAGLTGEPDPATIDEVLSSGTNTQIYQTIVNAVENADRYDAESGIRYAASTLEENRLHASNAQTIAEKLPQIEEIIANYDGSDFPRSDLAEWENPIHSLQTALDIESDGVFGPATAEALLDYEADGLINGFAGEHVIDTGQFSEIHFFAISYAYDAYAAKEQALEFSQREATLENQLEAQSQGYNDFIAEKFAECSGGVIDLSNTDPFGDILQEVQAFAQTVDEQAIAHENVAEAIHGACGDYLEQVPEDLRGELVAELAAKLETPLNEAVQSAIDNANGEIINNAIKAGRIIERFFN